MNDFSIDLDQLLLEKIKRHLPEEDSKEVFKLFDKLVIEYSKKSGMPEDGIISILIDSLDTGLSKEQIETQFRVYDEKRQGLLPGASS